MKFYERDTPSMDKPVVIAAMPDMGNVGGIVIDFIKTKARTRTFRVARTSYPDFVVDRGGYIETPAEEWSYGHAAGLVVFGGGVGQPRDGAEVHSICQDVVDVAQRYSAGMLYTVGGLHADASGPVPRTFAVATTTELAAQLKRSGFLRNPRRSVIRGFNGMILGYAKAAGIRGIGLYGELADPSVPQYRTAKAVIETLERLTYRRFGDTTELDAMAEYAERDGA